jgi:hypothetical protein
VAGFKRSSRFGVVGVFVVMAACAAIGLTLGSGEEPRLALGLIFGIVALYLVVLFALQRADLRAASGAAAHDWAKGPGQVENPTTMSDGELWAALAVKPIDAEAARARGATLEGAGRGIGMGMLICVLIFAGVVPIYLLDTFIPFLVCAPLIVLIALWGSVRAIGPGGDVAQPENGLPTNWEEKTG